MPELPEVEVTKMGITPHLQAKRIKSIDARVAKLRWPIPAELQSLENETIQRIERRGKYLLFHLDSGTIVVHLGMSGSLRILTTYTPPDKHEHVDLVCEDGTILRYKDPRRFGAWLWQDNHHPLSVLSNLGVEPLSTYFTLEYLREKLSRKRISIKQAIMDSHIVVGVGNIYATESLFSAKIDPRRSACDITEQELTHLIKEIRQVLSTAIKQGGTTLKDFTQADGNPGYFEQQLQVYGNIGLPCPVCQTKLQQIKLGQRTTVFCPNCQR